MNKVFLIFIILILTNCKNENKVVHLNTKKSYLIFRDSESKEGFFIKKFNIHKKNITHVGFLVHRKSAWVICHAIDGNLNNCIKFISINNFIKIKDKKYKVRILEIINFDKKELLIKKLDSFEKLNLKFDMTFSPDNPKFTYCSKFVCDVLSTINNSRFKFNLFNKKLNNIENSYLKKDTLKYYPVDLFFYNKNFSEK